jgi:hypothetical protein
VLHGVVTLSGTVTSQAAKVLASEEAGQVDGVKTVLNNLEVRSPIAAVPASPTPPPAPSALAKPVETLPRTITLTAGAFIAIRTSEPLSSKTAKANDEFHGMVAANIFLNNLVLSQSGTAVLGRVVEAKEAGHFVHSLVLWGR